MAELFPVGIAGNLFVRRTGHCDAPLLIGPLIGYGMTVHHQPIKSTSLDIFKAGSGQRFNSEQVSHQLDTIQAYVVFLMLAVQAEYAERLKRES